MIKNTFEVTGMTCSACSNRVEKVVSKVEGVKKVEVNVLTGSMQVEYDKKENQTAIIVAVQKAGYGASLQEKEKQKGSIDTKKMQTRLIISIICLVPLMYIAMGHMLGLPIPTFLHQPLHFTVAQVVLLIPIVLVNRNYFIHGFKNLVKASPNMDTLIAIGSTAAIVYGIYAIVKIVLAVQEQNMELANHFSMQVYFESAGMILTLITLGKYLETRAKGKTTEAVNKLIDLSPKMATIEKDGKEERILSQDIQVVDIVIVKPCEGIPVDGKVIEGSTYIDQAAITGESVPVKKQIGDSVITATINKNGSIKFVAQKVGEDTSLAQIIKLVEEASSTKAPIGKLADKISGIFVPIVITIAILVAVVWLIAGKDIEFALSIAISVLVISCPCALGLATPVSIMVGTGKGAENGILIKSAESLENAHSIQTVILDKTGTITEGKTKVQVLKMQEEIPNPEEILEILKQIEKKSEHPLGKAIIEYVEANQKVEQEYRVENFEAISGKGIKAGVLGNNYYIGNLNWMQENSIKDNPYKEEYEKYSKEGKTVIFFAKNQQLLGFFAIADTIKENSKQAIQNLQKMHVESYMLTGDNKKVASSIATLVGIEEENVIAEVLPQDKEKMVSLLQDKGLKVAMVGDGINDSPALTRADVGIAIGAGTDIAIESADIVLIHNNLQDVVTTIALSKATINNIKMNLFWAFFYNVIGIPIAAGILYPAFGFTLNPMIAAACMSLSSVCVVLNALRLKKFKK